VEALKIDRSIVGGMLADRDDRDMVELIILLAHRLKLQVIAEGVESTRHLDHLREQGCELGQGYLFSSPVDARAASSLLRQPIPVSHAKVAGTQ
jgi:EAL domain-containing protein (putative c-di-GMP-specific phosphodiesterase class I)